MGFTILSPITRVELIARGDGINKETRDRLRRRYGAGKWRKMKGHARIKLRNERVRYAEIHWYEADGIGRKDYKIKRYIDD
jgi:hypothetical protein